MLIAGETVVYSDRGVDGHQHGVALYKHSYIPQV